MKVTTPLCFVALGVTQAFAVVLPLGHDSAQSAPPVSTKRWTRHIDRVNGFSIRVPLGTTFQTLKEQAATMVWIEPPSPIYKGLWGLRIRVSSNPRQLSAEQLFRANLAAMEAHQKANPDMSIYNSITHSPILIGRSKGRQMRYTFANGHLTREVTLAWGKRAYRVGYEESNMDMTRQQQAENPQRIALLNTIISTIRPL